MEKKNRDHLLDETTSSNIEPETAELSSLSAEVPEPFQSIFLEAQVYIDRYFNNRREHAHEGVIEISGERYLLLRADTLALDFFDTVYHIYGANEEAHNVVNSLLFDISHSMGRSDARLFHNSMGLTDPLKKLSAGPLHFAHTGWAKVHIEPESHPTPDDDYILRFRHKYSFEADSWINRQRRSRTPVCIMNSGYSSGWCTESFGIPLVTVEYSCRARGDADCSFIMAPPHRIQEHIKRLLGKDVLYGLYLPRFFGRRDQDERLWHMAFFDQLTGLANRVRFRDKITGSFKHADRYRHLTAILFIDLDEFKRINDNHGHETGDAVLREIATRLTQSVRDTDTVARLGGDEFAVLLSQVSEKENITFITKKILSEISRPIRAAGEDICTSASVGISIYPFDGSSPEMLLSDADEAMYRAKRDGGNCYHFSDSR